MSTMSTRSTMSTMSTMPTIPEGHELFITYDDNENNLEVLQNLAAQGDSQAQFKVGKIYENKSAEEPQYNKEAEMWYRKEAEMWYRKAADQGHRDAQYKVSEIENCKPEFVCVVSGGKKTAKRRHKRRRKTSIRRRR